MTDMDAELIGLIAGFLNVVSVWPNLYEAWKHARRRPRDLAQIRGRGIQLAANLIWFGYAIHKDLWSVYLMTGLMSISLIVLLIQLCRPSVRQ